MSRLNMRGSVASFVVVGLVLAALVLGSIYVVKTQLAGKLQNDKTQVAVNQAKDTADDVIGGDSEKDESNNDSDKNKQAEKDKADQQAAKDQVAKEGAQAKEDAAKESEAQAAKDDEEAERKKTAAAKESEDKAAAEQSVSSETEETSMPSTGVTQEDAEKVEELPETGPTETLATVFAFGILASIIVAYHRSARAKA